MPDADLTPVAEVCRYSPQHTMDGVPATTSVYTTALGDVPCCQDCKDLYARLARGKPVTRPESA